MGRVAQARMPARRAPQCHNLGPQAATAQPLVTEHVYRQCGRNGRGQQSQQATEVVNPGGLRLHDMLGDGEGVLPIDHTDDQRPQLVLLAGALGARILRQLPRPVATLCHSGAKQSAIASS